MIPVLIESALRAVVVALTVGAGLRGLRVRNVPAQKAAWGLVLACAVAMPLVIPLAMRWQVLPEWLTLRLPANFLPANSFTSTPAAAPVSDAATLNLSAADVAGAPPVKSVDVPRRELHRASAGGGRFPSPVITASRGSSADADGSEAPIAATPSSMEVPSRWAAMSLPDAAVIATLLYATVCLLLLGRMAFGLALALKLWRAAEPFVPMPSSTGEPDPTLDLRVRFSGGVASPVTIGSGVLLPRECLEWDEQKLRIVLAHERAHVRQGDFYLQLAAGLYTAAFWFSPLGWWLKRTLCDLSETISDHAGLEEAASHASYAQVLLEFAALPRPTAIGVAMARSNNLSHRIERLLNESSFRQAFAGRRRRIVTAILLVPVALFAGTALIRVEAAQATQAVQAPPPAAPVTPADVAVPAPEAAPAAEAAPASPDQAAPAVPAPAPSPDAVPAPPAVPAMAPPPAAPGPYGEVRDAADLKAEAAELADAAAYAHKNQAYITAAAKLAADRAYLQSAKAAAYYQSKAAGYALAQSSGRGNSYSISQSNGHSYALVTEPGEKISFSGDWDGGTHANLDKARKMAHGKFLWFTHSGKSYIVDDPAIVAQLQALYEPIEELGTKQEALGKLQEDLGRQQEELGRKQEQATVPTPDISKEMAELNATAAKLDAKKGSTVSQEELADLEGKIGDLQGRLGDLQGKMGEKQGELGELQGKLGEKQGKLGEQQGLLGEQQGKLAEQADRKVKSVIDESLRNGKARPVE
jgi:hypothetical protein